MASDSESRGLADTLALEIGLERDAQAPALARAALAGFLAQRRIDPDALATLRLLVSEVVSNAVMHSDAPPSSEILLRARVLDDGGVRVEVTDRGSGFTPKPRDPDRHGGYGLYLLDKQATRWGVDGRDGGRVWFELGGVLGG
jgi:anti-sigma regulatory factor (Ser/Thr protein kinase)